jgi:flagellin-specific chaperone FliS
MEKDREKLTRIITMVGSLRDAWEQIAHSTETTAA